ncbi:MAG TPA: ATP-binding protein [Geomonas sp.]
MKDRLVDAKRDLRRASDDQAPRIQKEIEELEAQVSERQKVVDNPQAAIEETRKSIETRIKDERQPEKPVSGVSRTKFINPPPCAAPSYFQDRFIETGLIADFLQDEARRLITVVGRAGVGKSAMVCRLLKSLEGGILPNDRGELSVDGIVYLSALGSRKLTFPTLFSDLCRLLPDDVATRLDALYKDPQVSTTAKTDALLAAFPQGRTVLLLDNLEDVVDPSTQNITDPALDDALSAMLNGPQHGVRVIITTRIAPRELMLLQPGRQGRVDLDTGLGRDDAVKVLREMDADGKVGLSSASEELLTKAWERTLGFPRALEALYSILSTDRDTTLEELVGDAARLLPDNVVEVLVGQAFSRLDIGAQRVMEAMAIYQMPVTATAVDYLLSPYIQGVNSAPVLTRLVSMHFARKERGRYYNLHPVDRSCTVEPTTSGRCARPARIGSTSVTWLRRWRSSTCAAREGTSTPQQGCSWRSTSTISEPGATTR